MPMAPCCPLCDFVLIQCNSARLRRTKTILHVSQIQLKQYSWCLFFGFVFFFLFTTSSHIDSFLTPTFEKVVSRWDMGDCLLCGETTNSESGDVVLHT